MFTDVLDALTLVWFRFFERANVCGKVSEELLIVRLDVDDVFVVLVHLELDAIRCIDRYLVGISDREFEFGWSLHVELVSDTDDLKRLGVSLRQTDDHVRDEGTSESPIRLLLWVFRIGNRDCKDTVLLGYGDAVENIDCE